MNYEATMEAIMRETGMIPSDIEELVERKQSDLKGLISKEGALFVIAKELDVDINDKKKEGNKMGDDVIKKIRELRVGHASFQGSIAKIEPLKTITARGGEQMSLLNIYLSDDDSARIRATIWRDKADELSKTLKFGQIVLLKNVKVQFSNYSNENELSLTKNSEVEVIGTVKREGFKKTVEPPKQEGVDFKKLIETPPLPKITAKPKTSGGDKIDTVIELLQDIKRSVATIAEVMTKDLKPNVETADNLPSAAGVIPEW